MLHCISWNINVANTGFWAESTQFVGTFMFEKNLFIAIIKLDKSYHKTWPYFSMAQPL